MKDILYLWDRTLGLSKHAGLEPTGLMVNVLDFRAYAKATFTGNLLAGTKVTYRGVPLRTTRDLRPGECAAVIGA